MVVLEVIISVLAPERISQTTIDREMQDIRLPLPLLPVIMDRLHQEVGKESTMRILFLA